MTARIPAPQRVATDFSATPVHWPYTVRLHRGRLDHKARLRVDGLFEIACNGVTFPGGKDLTRPLCYRSCRACLRIYSTDNRGSSGR